MAMLLVNNLYRSSVHNIFELFTIGMATKVDG